VKEIAVFCPKTEFATDSSLEEDGFELPVPSAGARLRPCSVMMVMCNDPDQEAPLCLAFSCSACHSMEPGAQFGLTGCGLVRWIIASAWIRVSS